MSTQRVYIDGATPLLNNGVCNGAGGSDGRHQNTNVSTLNVRGLHVDGGCNGDDRQAMWLASSDTLLPSLQPQFAFQEFLLDLLPKYQQHECILSSDNIRDLDIVSSAVFRMLRSEIAHYIAQRCCKEDCIGRCSCVYKPVQLDWYYKNIWTIIDNMSYGGLINGVLYALKKRKSLITYLPYEVALLVGTIIRAFSNAFDLYTMFMNNNMYSDIDNDGILNAYINDPRIPTLPPLSSCRNDNTVADVETVFVCIIKNLWLQYMASVCNGCRQKTTNKTAHSCNIDVTPVDEWVDRQLLTMTDHVDSHKLKRIILDVSTL